MKKWQIILLATVSIGFISLNGYLIGKSNSKVDHTVYVSDWTQVEKGNIEETFDADTVIVPEEETNIYFSGENKEFIRFLVKEGDEIEEDTPLIEYTNLGIAEQKQTLNHEIDQLEAEIENIEDYISSLEDYQPTLSLVPWPDDIDEDLREYLLILDHTSTTLMQNSVQQKIDEKSLEQEQLEAKLDKYKDQLGEINTLNSTDFVRSETPGIIKKINTELGNPIITIASNVFVAEGLLTEEQYKKIELDMPFKTTTNIEETLIEGTISKISTFPINEPNVETENLYPFKAVLNDYSNLPVGSKLPISVITATANNVLTLEELAISSGENSYVLKLNKNGKITKQPVTIGLAFNGVQEVKNGVEINDLLLLDPENVNHDNANFVTTLKLNEIKGSAFKELSSKEKWKYFFTGFIEK